MKCIFHVWTLDIASLKISVWDIHCLFTRTLGKGEKLITGWINHYNTMSLHWLVLVPGWKVYTFWGSPSYWSKHQRPIYFTFVLAWSSCQQLPLLTDPPGPLEGSQGWCEIVMREFLTGSHQPILHTVGYSDLLPQWSLRELHSCTWKAYSCPRQVLCALDCECWRWTTVKRNMVLF